MSIDNFSAIASLGFDNQQLKNTGTQLSPILAFADNPIFKGNVIIENGFSLQFHDPSDVYSTNIKAGNQLVNIDLTLPLTTPSIGQVLISLDGAPGNLGWGNVITSTPPSITGGIAFFTDTSGTIIGCSSSGFFTWDDNANNFAASSYPTFVNGGGNAIIAGSSNLIDTGISSFIIGGASNQLQNVQNSGILGGAANTVTANKSLCFGGDANQVNGISSYAFGYKSLVSHDYSFVFSDHNNLTTGLQTTAAGQFLIQATGGFGFVSESINLTSFPNDFINIYSDTVSQRCKLQYKNHAGFTSTTILDVLQVKGDLYTFNSTTNDRLGVGANGQILSANSATATGLEWINNDTGSVSSISAGTNIVCTPDPIVSTGSVSLSNTPSGLTSLGVGSLNLSGTTITGITTINIGNIGISGNIISATGNLVLAPSVGQPIAIFNNTGTPVPIQFFNAAGSHYTGLVAGNPSSDVTFTLPLSDTAGVMVSNGSGGLSLTATPSGLTSIGVGNITITTNGITASQGFGLSINGTNAGILSINNGNDVGRIRLYNNIGNHYSGLISGASSSDNEWFLPSSDVAGVMVSNGSHVLSLTGTPSGLTSITAGDITIIGDKVTGTNGVLIESTGAGQSVGLSPKGAAQVRIFSQDSSNSVPLRFYNSANTHYVEFKAGTLSADTTWVYPTADSVGTLVSDGAANLSLTQSPSIYRSIVSVSGTSKTFALSDANTFQQCTNGSTVTLTLDTNANVAFTVGTEIDIFQEGAGQVVIAAAGGVTIESVSSNLKIANQYTGATLKKLATNTWCLIGNLTA